VLVALVDRRQPDDVLDLVVVRGRVLAAASFPSTHCAIAGALTVASAPYLGRLGRRLCVLGAAGVAVARLYVGAQFPVDVLGGLALGATVAAAVGLASGTPPARLTGTRLERLLRDRRIVVHALLPWSSATDNALFVGIDDARHERRLVRIVTRHEHGSGWISRGWRYLAFRVAEGLGPLRSPRERNEHVALMSVLAERSDVATPKLCVAGNIGTEYSFGVYALPNGRRLTELDRGEADTAVLEATWTEVGKLHAAGVILGRASPDDILVDDDGRAWLVDLGAAALTVDPVERARDTAEVFAGLAAVADPTDVATTGIAVLGADAIAEAAVYLNPMALSSTSRRLLRDHDDVLARGRAAIAAQTGTDESAVTPPVGVAVRNLALLVVGAVALYFLLGRVGQATTTLAALHTPQWAWVAVVVVAMTLTYLSAAVTLSGSTTTPLHFGRTFVVQFAAAFSNRLAPGGLGGMATNVRYLERSGSERPAAVAAVTVNSLAGFIVHAVALAAIVPAVGPFHSVDVDPPRYWPILLAGLAVSSVAGIMVGIRFMPANVGAKIRSALRSLADVLTAPRRALALFGGSAALTAAYAFALFAAVRAFGGHASFLSVVAVYLGASAIGALSPTPGGLGALDAGLIAGITHVGVPASIAVAGVLSYRLITYWFPVVPGVVAFRWLRRKGHL
ncbi:MAG: glycosyltransferase 2 family protein, partial [Acidimicrobiaceae bacterium]|nr:glycosyltransferase 2 family protein [Acidimicrobiaceae bacterium]